MNFGKLKDYTVDGRNVFLHYEHQDAKIEVITPEIIRIFCGFEDDGTYSHAIEAEKAVETEFTVTKTEDGCVIATSKVCAVIGDGFTVDFYDHEDRPVCLEYRGNRRLLTRVSDEAKALLEAEGHEALEGDREHKIQIMKAMEGSESFYGLGDKTGFMDKRNYDYIMWNTDDPSPQVDSFKSLYKSIPFFITLTDSHVYGLFFDNTYRSWFDMGKESTDYFWFGADEGNLDYYYIAGNTMAEVVKNYTYLTGTCPLPQKWTLGYHQSRWGYTTWDDIRDVAENMRKNEIPCDAIHFDIDYMQDYKVFTWNESRYEHDPKACLDKLVSEGIKPVTIIDPGVKKEDGYHVYDDGLKKDCYAKDSNGEVYVNAVWPGDAVYPDFGSEQVRAWWGEQHKFLTDCGVRGVWNDMNEPASFNGPLPDDVVFSENGKPALHKKMHNVYGHHMAEATYKGLKKLDGRRPFVITRACYAGSQKYTTAWTGDNHSIWAHLQMAVPQICNMGLSGMPFVGTDVGGFASDATPELMARWVQVGCFSPLFRNHSETGSIRQEPWLFGENVLNIYRKYVNLRYKLIPYFYDLFVEAEKTGTPVIRPLVFHYEQDKNVRDINDEFMVGPSILVAPVVTQGAVKRMVYLPEGTWYDYWTGEKVEGNTFFIKDAPLDTCPMYVKAGTILPTMPPVQYVGEKEEDTLILEVFKGEGSLEHYLDNGEDFAYRDGAYHQYHFEQDEKGNVTGTIIHAGYEKPYQKILIRDENGEREL